jgi:hypothetical protein
MVVASSRLGDDGTEASSRIKSIKFLQRVAKFRATVPHVHAAYSSPPSVVILVPHFAASEARRRDRGASSHGRSSGRSKPAVTPRDCSTTSRIGCRRLQHPHPAAQSRRTRFRKLRQPPLPHRLPPRLTRASPHHSATAITQDGCQVCSILPPPNQPHAQPASTSSAVPGCGLNASGCGLVPNPPPRAGAVQGGARRESTQSPEGVHRPRSRPPWPVLGGR